MAWLQTATEEVSLAGKLGGAFATEKYIHGGAENAISTILAHELTCGMMVYSSGHAQGAPCIHLGPVGMGPNIDAFRELFTIYVESTVLSPWVILFACVKGTAALL